MSKFQPHIDNIVGRRGSLVICVLRSTICRSVKFKVFLWMLHLRPLIKSNSCFWNVEYLGVLRLLESLLRRWMRMFSKRPTYTDFLVDDLITAWKSFHTLVDVGLGGVIDWARDVDMKTHSFKTAILVFHTNKVQQDFWSKSSKILELPSI